jgi:uncharacterized iron-regulated membrane protein
MTTKTAAVRARRIVRQLHRWIGLLIGIQVLLWVSGGLIMSVLRLDEVRGEHRVAAQPPAVLAAGERVTPVADVIGRVPGKVSAVTLTTFVGQPVYRVESDKGKSLLDARTGQRLSPLPEDLARRVALADYAGPGRLLAMEWVEQPAVEYRDRELPLWRARFDDEDDTTLYISPQTGLVVARRNELWRLFDFVWMLHIMDYEEREDFNHPLLVIAAATACLFVCTGLVMLFFSFRRAERSAPARPT